MLKNVLSRVQKFQTEVHKIFKPYETSVERIVELSVTYQKLSGFTLKQDDLFRQALRCVENGLYKASHVMSWAAFTDFYQEKITSDGFVKLHLFYPNWAIYTTVEDLRENITEFSLIEAGRKIGLLTKTQMKALHGLLNKRNECAHPSNYYPEMNEALGFISELFSRIKELKSKTL